MDKSIKDSLLACRSYDEAKPILETSNAGIAVHKLFSTGYGVQSKQPTIARDFFNVAIQEMEDDDEKIKEVDGGKSVQSSSTTGLEKVGSESDAAESASAQADKKDQMGVAINEAFPPQQPGMMPPQAAAPPMQPQQQMGGQCGGQVPPQQPTPQQQMQYTINESVRAALAPMQEALKALDKKIQETTINQTKSLAIGSSIGKQPSVMIRETTGNKAKDLAKVRLDITKLNHQINDGF